MTPAAGAGITTGAGITVVGDAAVTTRGPDGNSESNPRPKARRFSTGLYSSTAAIYLLLSKYIVSRYINFTLPTAVIPSEAKSFACEWFPSRGTCFCCSKVTLLMAIDLLFQIHRD
jgi:hypothetical protein